MTPAALVSIVEDDESMRMATASAIRSMGWDVLTFESAAAFLDSGAASQTHCLISDVSMPGMSGIEMHACLLANGYAPPTIFLTGYPTARDEAAVLANGALAYLPKPADFDIVARSVKCALDKARSPRAD
ncbi:response regulator transcription factor [Paraburkholderia sp. BR10937]|uniref:response regulator transcription factor n=1 Tax=Paraburkholderia sp. BR10937 TaxID=3236994 RepID=UPI0034D33676